MHCLFCTKIIFGYITRTFSTGGIVLFGYGLWGTRLAVSVKYEAASLLLFWYGNYKAGASHTQYRNGGIFLGVFFPSKLDEL